ncbi:hypothetical protein CN918_30590 [Priestia megaterium]|nr:hypothetical protein CN918_30590 [Priestia megaterium]
MNTDWKKDYHERVRQLAPFEVFAYFEQRHKYKQFPLYKSITQAVEHELPLRDFLFPIMQHMLSSMYQREKITHEHLEFFFSSFILDAFSVKSNQQDVHEFCSFLIDECLRNQGKKHVYSYFDYQEKRMREAFFDYIEYDRINPVSTEDDHIYMKLSFESIELLFKTKEIFGEMQLSIKQLYFKEQMKKGYFHDALQTVTELIYDIELEKEKIEKLKIEVKRNVLAVTKKGSLKEQVQNIMTRLDDQRTIFNEMNELVKDTMDKYYKGKLNDKVRQGIDIINEIDKRLNETISLHEELFKEKSVLRSLTHEVLSKNLFKGFGRAFNFEREVLQRSIENRASEEIWMKLLKPMYPLKPHAHFNIMSVFKEQRRLNKREEKTEVMDIPSEEEIRFYEENEKMQQEAQEQKEQRYLAFLLRPLLQRETVMFSELVDLYNQETVNEDVIDMAELYSFVITLHQRNDLHIEKIPDDTIHYIDSVSRNLSKFYDIYKEQLMFDEFSIHPLQQEVVLNEEYVVLDFTLARKERDERALHQRSL